MMVNHMASQGYDPNQTMAFLDHVGIAEENPYWCQFMMQQGYINQMKKKRRKRRKKKKSNFNFINSKKNYNFSIFR